MLDDFKYGISRRNFTLKQKWFSQKKPQTTYNIAVKNPVDVPISNALKSIVEGYQRMREW